MNPFSCTACAPASTSAAAASPFSLLNVGGESSSIARQFFGMMQFLQHANMKESSPALMNGMHARFQTLTAQDMQGLQSLLAGVEGGENASFPNNVLLALTVGVPAELLPEGVESNTDGLVSLTFDQLSELVSSHSDALSNGNILLVAANITPEDMESLAKSLSAVNEEEKANPFDIHFVLVTLAPTDEEGATPTEIANSQSHETDIGVNWVALTNFLASLDPKPVATSDDFVPSLSGFATGEDKKSFAPRSTSILHGMTETAGESSDEPDSHISSPSSGAKENGTTLSSTLSADNPLGSSFSSKDWALWNGQKVGFELGNPMGGLFALPAATSSSLSAFGSPLLSNPSAAVAHPATQTLTAILGKISENGKIKAQTLSVELDPPELGRVQIHLSLEKGEPMKVRVVAEKEDTLVVLRRDSHALRQALDAAGVQTDGSSLSFDMSQDSSAFGQALAHQQGQGEKHRSAFMFGDGEVSIHDGPVTDVMETALGIVVDEQTGRVCYNILA